MEKNIVLTGFMGAGKSTVGRRLANALKRNMVDTDDMIEREAGMGIPEIFAKHGEDYFRDIEEKIVAKASSLKNHVIVTGGGVVLREKNIQNLRRNGVIIYLHASPEVIYERVKNQTHRPLLQVKDPMGKIRELLEFRAPFYANNDYTIDTSSLTVEEVVDEVLNYLSMMQ
jgi:shikimate kinase